MRYTSKALQPPTLVKVSTRLERPVHEALQHYAIETGSKIERLYNAAVKDYLVRRKRLRR